MEIISLFNIINPCWILLGIFLMSLVSYICWKVPYEYNTFEDCVSSIGGNDATILIPNEQEIEDDMAVPTNVILRVIQGGFFTVAAGKTLTISGRVEASSIEIFKGAGTVIVNSFPQNRAWWGDAEQYERKNVGLLSAIRKESQALATFSFDDGWDTDYTKMLPLFNTQGEVAVSGIVTDWIGNANKLTWNQVKELRDAGWEIASHSKTHANLTGLNEAQIRTELTESKQAIEDQGIVVKNLVYPFGAANTLVMRVTSEYYNSGRATGPSDDEAMLNRSPLYTFNLNALLADDHTLLATYQAFVDDAETTKAWIFFYIHQTDNNDVTALGTLIDYIQAKNIPIVTIQQGLDLVGNVVDIGGEASVGVRGIRASSIKLNEESEDTVSIGFLAGNPLSTGQSINIGYQTGRVNTTGDSVNIGYNAGRANTESRSVNIGHQAGLVNTTGQCVNIGYQAGRANTTAPSVSIGYRAGTANTTGYSVNIGFEAGLANLAGRPVNVGYQAGRANTSGYSVSIGYQAGLLNTTGQSTNVGYKAGSVNVGGNLIAIGYGAGLGAVPANAPANDPYGILIGYNANRSVASANVLTNYIGIGYGVLIDKDNQTKIGNAATVECYLRGSLLLDLASVPAHANNAAAAGGGVAVGGIYRTNADPSVLCIRSA